MDIFRIALSNVGARAVLLVPDCEGIHSTDLPAWKQFGQNSVGVNRCVSKLGSGILMKILRFPKTQESNGHAALCCHVSAVFIILHNIPTSQCIII